ncbi:GerW family sporulation protein [Brockia lithotrophica]|uniref:Sporulation protein YtfJ n=1 Tax=Brockia lithotrophica TaxID=933949 RepID=A0A660KW28_9BACL|nr:GerW family sporulation protein [Brockia lithotrophica]RKQ83659.1 sporulation protein YtfJ [Brockia lithotrophica]
MSEHPIQSLMSTAMENIQGMVDVSTIVGDPIETPDGSVVLPVSRVGFGFVAGGSEFQTADASEETLPFGGGSGGGVTITPVGFLVIGREEVRFVPLEPRIHLYDRLLDLAPEVLQKIEDLLSRGKGRNPSREVPPGPYA